MASVSLREVKKCFGKTEVVHNVSFDIDNGGFLCIVGPSGCGKSTILRMIAGLEYVSAGTIYIGDRVVNELEPRERDIAMVFQNYALYPHMSVFNNLAYGLKVRRVSRSEIERRVKETARILDIGSLLERKPRELSGGQRQRVAMGRAIVRKPEVFLFDEPLSNLDAKLRMQMRVELKRLHHQLKTTSVYVTHDQVEAMTLADRILVVNEGRLEQLGTPKEIYHRPASVFVAKFVGSPSMNLFPAVRDIQNRRLRINGEFVIPDCIDAAAYSDDAVLVGIRPEHFQPAAANSVSGEWQTLKVSVELIEILGADIVAHCLLHDKETDLIVRLSGESRIEEGDDLPLAFHLGHLHYFDSKTGCRIG
jgi:sn-glycerol 3-phosphate transport system ATP-binding protein